MLMAVRTITAAINITDENVITAMLSAEINIITKRKIAARAYKGMISKLQKGISEGCCESAVTSSAMAEALQRSCVYVIRSALYFAVDLASFSAESCSYLSVIADVENVLPQKRHLTVFSCAQGLRFAPQQGQVYFISSLIRSPLFVFRNYITPMPRCQLYKNKSPHTGSVNIEVL